MLLSHGASVTDNLISTETNLTEISIICVYLYGLTEDDGPPKLYCRFLILSFLLFLHYSCFPVITTPTSEALLYHHPSFFDSSIHPVSIWCHSIVIR
jgi:hypothetical protein